MNYHKIIHHYKNNTKETSIRNGLGLQAKMIDGLEYDCRKADCGICSIKILSGAENLSAPREDEKDFLSAMQAESSERLACQCRVFGNIEIEIPDLDP